MRGRVHVYLFLSLSEFVCVCVCVYMYRCMCVLIDAKDSAKITDFGLSRDLEDGKYYSPMEMGQKLPLRWCAPELFLIIPPGETDANGGPKQRFSEATDMYAYGVTLHETFNRAKLPYADITNKEMIFSVASGHRMDKPESMPQALFDQVVMPSMVGDATKRLKFKEVVAILERLEPELGIKQGLVRKLSQRGVDEVVLQSSEVDDGPEKSPASVNQEDSGTDTELYEYSPRHSTDRHLSEEVQAKNTSYPEYSSVQYCDDKPPTEATATGRHAPLYLSRSEQARSQKENIPLYAREVSVEEADMHIADTELSVFLE